MEDQLRHRAEVQKQVRGSSGTSSKGSAVSRHRSKVVVRCRGIKEGRLCSGKDSVKCVVQNGTERVVKCAGGGQSIDNGGK